MRIIKQGAFYGCKSLRTAVLNEGLEVLGTDERELQKGVFENSALESITLPSTLRRIEYAAFYGCKGIKFIQLPKCLEAIGVSCFHESGLEEIKLPESVRTVSAFAFQECRQLRRVELNEGLKTLGGKQKVGPKEFEGEAFYGSGI